MALGFPCGSADKQSTCKTGDLGWIAGLERSPGEGKGYYPLQNSGLENSMEWGRKELDTTERLPLSLSLPSTKSKFFKSLKRREKPL